MVWSIIRLPGVFSRSDKTWEMPRGSSRTVHWADRSWFVLASRFSCRSLFNPNKYWFRFQFPLLTLFDIRVIIFKVSSFFSFLRVFFLFLDGSTCILLFVCLTTIDVFAFIVLWIVVKLGDLTSFRIFTVGYISSTCGHLTQSYIIRVAILESNLVIKLYVTISKA